MRRLWGPPSRGPSPTGQARVASARSYLSCQGHEVGMRCPLGCSLQRPYRAFADGRESPYPDRAMAACQQSELMSQHLR
jgi:hypothetical protein